MSKQIQIIYLLLFIGLIIQPHVIKGHILGLPESIVESIGTIVLLLLGYIAYQLHQYAVGKKQKEMNKLTQKLDVSSKRLLESYEYIGLVNRKLPIMENITSDLLERTSSDKKAKVQVFSDLLAAAAGIVRVDWGMFRIINIETGSTTKEFVGSGKKYAILKTRISNKELLACDGEGRQAYSLGEVTVLRTSDMKTEEQTFLILPKVDSNLNDNISLIQNLTDQAQLFYKYLYKP